MDISLIEKIFVVLATGGMGFMWWQYKQLIVDIRELKDRLIATEEKVKSATATANAALSEGHVRSIVREEMAEMKADIKSLVNGMSDTIGSIDKRLNQLMMHMLQERNGKP